MGKCFKNDRSTMDGALGRAAISAVHSPLRALELCVYMFLCNSTVERIGLARAAHPFVKDNLNCSESM